MLYTRSALLLERQNARVAALPSMACLRLKPDQPQALGAVQQSIRELVRRAERA
jgi:hypothetical protein